MNRKDTILIAVLLNALLLVVLFFSAAKGHEDKTLTKIDKPVAAPIAKSALPKKEQITPPPKPIAPPAPVAFSAKPVEEKSLVVEKVVETPPPPPPPPPAPAKVEKKVKTYTVQRGDSLDRIARRLSVSTDDLMKVNDLVETRLAVGQVLEVPEKTLVPEPVATDEMKYYIVKGGDSPWTIAQKHHMQVSELLRLNNIDETKAKRLKPGDKLRVK